MGRPIASGRGSHLTLRERRRSGHGADGHAGDQEATNRRGPRDKAGSPGEVPKSSLKAGLASRILLREKLGRDAVTRRVSFPGMIF
jgi:hypothetical protein